MTILVLHEHNENIYFTPKKGPEIKVNNGECFFARKKIIEIRKAENDNSVRIKAS